MSKVPASIYQFDGFSRALISSVHNFTSHNFKFLLANNQPLSSFQDISDINEILSGTGYTAGGLAAVIDANFSQEGIAKVVFRNISLKAIDGNIGPFRFVVVANSSAAVNQLCWFYDLNESITITRGHAASLTFQSEALRVNVDAESY